MVKKSGLLVALAAIIALVAAVACTREVVKEVQVPQVVTETVVKEVPVEVVVEREVVKEIPVEVVVEKEVVREVEVPVERVVEKEVVREVEVPVVVEKEVVREVEKVVEVAVGPGEEAAKVLNLRASSAVTKLSPYTAVSGYVGLIGNHIFSRLLIADPHEQRFIPELAERWEISDDGSFRHFLPEKERLLPRRRAGDRRGRQVVVRVLHEPDHQEPAGTAPRHGQGRRGLCRGHGRLR